MSSIGLGILGLAHGHVSTYCQEWLSNPAWGVEPRALWDHDASRLAQAGEKWPQLSLAKDVTSMLAREDIQAVVIGAETSHHADLVEQAAAAGKAIILQKPIATTLADADRIVHAVQQSGVPFTMAWQMRVDPQNLKIKALIDEGILGSVSMVRRRHGLPTQQWAGFESSWHVDPKLNGSIWADDASHAIDWLLWLLGEPQSVTAEITEAPADSILMNRGTAVYKYANGLLAVIECSFATLAAENTTEVIGQSGTIIQNYGDLPSCSAPRPSQAVGLKWYLQEQGWIESDIPTPASHAQRIAALAHPLAEFLQGKRDAIATASAGRQSLAMLLASCHASNQGRRVLLSEITPSTVI